MDRTGQDVPGGVTASPEAIHGRVGRAWLRVLHEVVFAERPVRVASGSVTSSPLDTQIVLVAPGGASALLTTCWYGRAEPVDGAALAERVQVALTDLLGLGVRCLPTQGPVAQNKGAWSEGARGTVGLVFTPPWQAEMRTPPVPAGTDVRIDIVLDGWPGSGSGTLVIDGDVAMRVTSEAGTFMAVGHVDTTSFQLRESEREVAPGMPHARFDGSVLGVRRGAWNVAICGDGVLLAGGSACGTARWITDGSRIAVRVDPDSPAAEPEATVGSHDEVETVVIDRGAMRDVLRGRGAVATDESQ